MEPRILAVDIGASTVKMAEFVATKSGGLELTNFGVASLGAEQVSDAERFPHIVTTIREIMRERAIKPGPAYVSVAGQSVFSRFVRLPPVDKDKVYQIIRYEAQQNVPFPIEEVVWDYQLIGRGEGELDVMLAAIKADLTSGIAQAVQEAGLEVQLIDVAPVALYNAARFNYSDKAGCTLVIDMGARSTDLIFIEAGRVFMRSVPVAGNAITQQIMREFELSFEDAEEMKRAHSFVAFGGAYEAPPSEVADKVSKIVRSVMTRMHSEINRSINFYRSQQNGQQPELVLLTGGCSVIPYSDVFLKEKLKVDVDYLNPFVNVTVSERIGAEEIGRNAQVMGQLVGLGLRKVLACPIEINLLPPAVLDELAMRKKQPYYVMAMACLVLTVLVWYAYFAKLGSLVREPVQRYKSEVSQLEPVDNAVRGAESRLAEQNGHVDRLMSLIARRRDWMDVLAALQKSLPADLAMSEFKPLRPEASANPLQPATPPPASGYVTQFVIKAQGYTDLGGIKSGDAITQFLTNLDETAYFAVKEENLDEEKTVDVVKQFVINAAPRKPVAE